MKKNKRLDISAARKLKLTLATGKVECQVSGRWLQFPNNAPQFPDGAYFIVNVMTQSETGADRKLCELVVRKQDLEQAISQVHIEASEY